MFESGTEQRVPSSDRYGIMEKLKRLQDGEELDDLLAEIDEELPDDPMDEMDELEGETMGMTAMQKRVRCGCYLNLIYFLLYP